MMKNLNPQHKNMSRKIYEEAFGKSPEFDDVLFGSLDGYLYCAFEKDEVRAALFALPCILSRQDKKTDAYYIYACATDKNFRNRGYMSGLLKMLQRKTLGTPLFLVPSSAKLIPFYIKSGFRPIRALKSIEGDTVLSPVSWGEILPKAKNADGTEYIMMAHGEMISEIISFAYVMDI
jgi:predicted acetyltransferase